MIEQLMALNVGDTIIAAPLFPGLREETFLDVIEKEEANGCLVLGVQLIASSIPVQKLIITVINGDVKVEKFDV